MKSHSSASAAAPSLVELWHVSKRFGTVTALDDISINIHPGEVHCLLGDNGHCQLLVQEFGKVNLANCDLLDNTGPKWEVRNGATLLIEGKPAPTESAKPKPSH